MAYAATFNSQRPSLPADVRLMNATANLLLVLVALGVLAAAVMWGLRQPAFAIRTLRVEGDVTRNSAATIRANAGPHLSGNFFTLNLGQSKRAFESVPWVREAVVQRIWPNRLTVRLQEHRAAAIWGEDKLVNSFGEVFEANLGDVEDDGLPTLKGPDGSSARMLEMVRRLRPLFETLDATVDTLELSGRGSWRATLDNGAVIEIGRGNDDELMARCQRFVDTLTPVRARYQQRPLEYADLRHPDGYALRLKGVTTTLTPLPGTPASSKNKPQH
jgi:cell division protein FtsQ